MGSAGCASRGRPARRSSCSFVLRFIRVNLNSEGREERFRRPRNTRERRQRETNIKRKIFPDLLRHNSDNKRKNFRLSSKSDAER